jgi:hypothetical protein
MHVIRNPAKWALCLAAAALLLIRAAAVILGLMAGDEAELLAYPLSAILPAVLILGLALLPPTVSREGALMRLGAMIQLNAIIAMPGIALHLALGLPVVFLVVELYETRLPKPLRDATSRWFIA